MGKESCNPELARERAVEPGTDVLVAVQGAGFAALAVEQGETVSAARDEPGAVGVELEAGDGVGECMVFFAVVAKLADGDGRAAVVVGEQAEGFVDGEVARRLAEF